MCSPGRACCCALFVHLPGVLWKHSYEAQLGQGAGLILPSVPWKPLTMGFEQLSQLLETHRGPWGLPGAYGLFPEASCSTGQLSKSVSDSLTT